MGKQNKKAIRKVFRDAVFERANYNCQGSGCSFISSKDKAEQDLASHHVQNRIKFENGGYVASNGIALCASCHIKAEWMEQNPGSDKYPEFSVDNLYAIIGSSLKKAILADKENNGRIIRIVRYVGYIGTGWFVLG